MLSLAILYTRTCYCQYCMEEVVIVNIIWKKLLLSILYGGSCYLLYGGSCYCQYNMPETVIVNAVC